MATPGADGRLVYWNGDYVPETEARISIFDSALMFGDMVFEMTRTFDGAPFRLHDHLERLYASLGYARFDGGLSIDELEAATHATIAKTNTHWPAWTFRSCTT